MLGNVMILGGLSFFMALRVSILGQQQLLGSRPL